MCFSLAGDCDCSHKNLILVFKRRNKIDSAAVKGLQRRKINKDIADLIYIFASKEAKMLIGTSRFCINGWSHLEDFDSLFTLDISWASGSGRDVCLGPEFREHRVSEGQES